MRRLRPEVCLDHRRVFDDRLRAAFGDLHALLDHNDVLGQREDGPHDMLDDQGAEPDFLLDPYEQVHRISEFFGRQSGEDLVEQDDSGPRPEDPPELEPFPFLDGQVRGRHIRLAFQSHEFEHAGHSRNPRSSGTYFRREPTIPSGTNSAMMMTTMPMMMNWKPMRTVRKMYEGMYTTTAPISGPSNVPIPPMTIIASICNENIRLNA